MVRAALMSQGSEQRGAQSQTHAGAGKGCMVGRRALPAFWRLSWRRNCFLLWEHLGWKKLEVSCEPRQGQLWRGKWPWAALPAALPGAGRSGCRHRQGSPEARGVLRPPHPAPTESTPQLAAAGPCRQPSLHCWLASPALMHPPAGIAGAFPSCGVSPAPLQSG